MGLDLNMQDMVDSLDGGDEDDIGGGDVEDEALCPSLHLIAALIESGEEVEGVWEQLLFPLVNVYTSLLLYTQRALADLLSSYLTATLRLGLSRMKPKGSELVAILESEVDSLL